jgi:hypothetical protein
MQPQAVLYTDMALCMPSTALATDGRPGCWRVVPYTTEDGISGTMLYAAPEDHAPEITLPLQVTGWHAVYIGINYTRAVCGDIQHHTIWPLYGVVWAKLSADPGYTRFAPEVMLRHADHLPNRAGREKQIWDAIHEVYWTTADLSGQSITIRPPAEPYNDPSLAQIANIAYVRLVPLDAEQVAAWHNEQPLASTRRLSVHWCTDALTGQGAGSMPYYPRHPQWITEELAPFFQSDTGLITMEAIRGDMCTFPSSLDDAETFAARGEVNPLAIATQLAHEHQIKVFAGLRLLGAGYPVIRAPIQQAQTFWAMQRYAVRDREGNPCSNLSLAYAEVRNHWIALLREALLSGCDGIQVLLLRSHPFVLYEPPVIATFIEQHGVDPRLLAETDPRWLRHRSTYVTTFLRDIRQLLDEPGYQGRRELGVTFLAHADPLLFACDVDTWIIEGLVDYLMPNSALDPIDINLIQHWRNLGGEHLHIHPDLEPRTQPGEAYVALAQRYYDAGADGLHLWDGERRPPRASEWAILRRLGHQELLATLAAAAPGYWRRVPLKLLGGLAVRHSFHDG